jgi:hypothetical protein
MSHTYASVTDFKRQLVEGGTDYGTTNDPELLAVLEGASRRIDAWCNRGPSGFGPRTGTNVYDSDGSARLDLADDLLTFTSGTVAGQTGGTPVAITETTDFYLEPYNLAQKRRLYVHRLTGVTIGYGYRIWSIIGKWGYSEERVVATSLANEAMDASETGFDVDSGPEFATGQTLLVDSEQMYVTGIATNTLTVVRGANGTTAATHANDAPISVYRYPREVVSATLTLAMRRWRSRQAGLTGEIGGEGSGFAAVGQRDTENSILHTLDHLRFYEVA